MDRCLITFDLQTLGRVALSAFTLLLGVAGVHELAKAIRMRITGIKTMGVIVEVQEVSGAEGGLMRLMKVEYEDTTGKSHVFRDNTANGVYHGPVGVGIPVVYERSNPSAARINTIDHLWELPILLVVFGFGGAAMNLTSLCNG